MNKKIFFSLIIMSFNGNAMQQDSKPNRFKSDTNRFKGPNRFKPESLVKKSDTQEVSNPEFSAGTSQEALSSQKSKEIIEQFRMQTTASLQEDVRYVNDIFERIKKDEKISQAEYEALLQNSVQESIAQKEAFAKAKALIERQEQ